jgi:hypothetical protein
MNLKQKLQAIGKKYGVRLSIAEPIKLSEAETADGKMIYTPAEKWEVGVPCYSDAEGTTPCPDGEYVLTTGETVVVADGVVTAINMPEEELTAEQALEAVDALTAKLDETTAERDAIKSELASIKSQFADLKKKSDDLTIENTKLRKQPVADPKKGAAAAKSTTTEVTPEVWAKMSIAERTRYNLSKFTN